MKSLDRWCKAMSSSPETCITLQNVMFDVDKRRSDVLTTRAVFEKTVAHWETKVTAGASDTDPAAASASLSVALDGLPPSSLCLAQPSLTVTESVSRIIDRGPFEHYYLRSAAFGHMTRPSAPSTLALPKRFTPRQIRRDAMFRKPIRRCYWIAPSEVIARVTASVSPDKRATRVRDHLGLQHFRNREELVEIVYPKGVLERARVARPTFIEGACNYVYRSHDGADNWGRAVDLEFPDQTDPDKLAPEAVHEAIDFTDEFTVRPLGVVRGSRRCSPAKLGRLRTWAPDDPNHLDDYTS